MSESPNISVQGLPRKDRLFALIEILRDGRMHRAQDMARHLGVTPRTLYRDMDTLAASGVPVGAKRGAGYQMNAEITLPPLNMSMAELETLHLGLAVMHEADDPALRAASRSLAVKIDAALPENRVGEGAGSGLAVFPFADTASGIRHIPALRSAIRKCHKVDLRYRGQNDEMEHWTAHPLSLDYWGRVWTCHVWCVQKQEHQTLRVDRITQVENTGDTFDETGEYDVN